MQMLWNAQASWIIQVLEQLALQSTMIALAPRAGHQFLDVYEAQFLLLTPPVWSATCL